MWERWLVIRATILLLLAGIALVVWFPVISLSATNAEQNLTVRFLDVGQGDAIHIKTPQGQEMLIDGGASPQVLRELAKERSVFDRSIDVLVATHPDADHVSGLVDVLERYEVSAVLQSKVESDTGEARAFAAASQDEGAEVIYARGGQSLQLGASTSVRILSPNGDATNWSSNNASVVLQVTYGEIDFMLTGDAYQAVENFLVEKYGESLESEVLKLGHHGSQTSTSDLFLETVAPEMAVVSAGLDNRYGHPHSEVLDRVREDNIRIFNTATDGTLTFQTDGKTVWTR